MDPLGLEGVEHEIRTRFSVSNVVVMANAAMKVGVFIGILYHNDRPSNLHAQSLGVDFVYGVACKNKCT